MYMKLENLQKTGSFKARGALYAINQLSDEQKKRGVVAASAGNHAQGGRNVFAIQTKVYTTQSTHITTRGNVHTHTNVTVRSTVIFLLTVYPSPCLKISLPLNILPLTMFLLQLLSEPLSWVFPPQSTCPPQLR